MHKAYSTLVEIEDDIKRSISLLLTLRKGILTGSLSKNRQVEIISEIEKELKR